MAKRLQILGTFSSDLPSVTENDNGKVLSVVDGKWMADDLQQTIDDALLEAKESGEFDGAPGKDGKDGVDGADGKDGYTPIKNVDYFDGKDGKNGLDGKDGVNGQDGQDGYTPVKGTDYWTESDKAEIKAYVDEAILGGEW